MKERVPNQTTLILVVHKVKSEVCPGFLDLLDILFKGHLDTRR